MLLNQRVALIRPNIVFTDYIDYVIKSQHIQGIITEAKNSTNDNISMGDIYNFPIPLPPLAEQKSIVAKIEELLPKVEAYGKAQEALDKLNEELPEKLKKSILQEAIEGRLVPQDPNDEPASVLLDKIRAEKKRLVKEGKLKKKDLEESPISEDEKPFEIPESWEWCKLGWIGDWGAGATPAKGNPEYYDNGTIPWLRTGELNNAFVYDSEIKVTPKALEKCSLRMCNVGDVLIAMYGATIGKVAIAGIKLTTNQACCACTPYEIYNKYLLYYLMASKKTFIEMGEGGAQPNISREKIIAFPFPLPPLAEQKRIVAKIEEVFAEIDKLK
jgi:type I restriction enzyme S subunit